MRCSTSTVTANGGESEMKATVTVRLKPGVLDPQGRAIQHALGGLGFTGVEDVRVGKLIELELAEDADVDAMCRALLANPVIESYRIARTNDGQGGEAA